MEDFEGYQRIPLQFAKSLPTSSNPIVVGTAKGWHVEIKDDSRKYVVVEARTEKVRRYKHAKFIVDVLLEAGFKVIKVHNIDVQSSPVGTKAKKKSASKKRRAAKV